MDKASEAILSLKPVTFHYKKEIVADRTPQFGLVAEDVEKVNPDLVVKDRQGNFYCVRYDAVNAMLLNEFLKEHRKNEEQQKHGVRTFSRTTERAGSANPEGERPARIEQTCAANGQQSLKLRQGPARTRDLYAQIPPTRLMSDQLPATGKRRTRRSTYTNIVVHVPNYRRAGCWGEQHKIRVPVFVKICSTDQSPDRWKSRPGYRPDAVVVAQIPNACCTCVRIVQQVVWVAVSVEICKACHIPTRREIRTRIRANTTIIVHVPNHGGEATGIEQQVVWVPVSVKICNSYDRPLPGKTRAGCCPDAVVVAQIPNACSTCVRIVQQHSLGIRPR